MVAARRLSCAVPPLPAGHRFSAMDAIARWSAMVFGVFLSVLTKRNHGAPPNTTHKVLMPSGLRHGHSGIMRHRSRRAATTAHVRLPRFLMRPEHETTRRENWASLTRPGVVPHRLFVASVRAQGRSLLLGGMSLVLITEASTVATSRAIAGHCEEYDHGGMISARS